MVVNMTDKIDIVEGKIVGEIGLHNHILANFVKFGFGSIEEAKPSME